MISDSDKTKKSDLQKVFDLHDGKGWKIDWKKLREMAKEKKKTT